MVAGLPHTPTSLSGFAREDDWSLQDFEGVSWMLSCAASTPPHIFAPIDWIDLLIPNSPFPDALRMGVVNIVSVVVTARSPRRLLFPSVADFASPRRGVDETPNNPRLDSVGERGSEWPLIPSGRREGRVVDAGMRGALDGGTTSCMSSRCGES